MKTTLEFLFVSEPPWIYVGSGEPERKKWIPSYFYTREGINVCVRRLRGKKMRTTLSLMNEFAASLQFFEEFGENWYALGDCLNCLDEWLHADAYILVIENAEELLQDDQTEQLKALIQTLHESGEWWSKPITNNDRFNRTAIPFHVLLNMDKAESSAANRIYQIAVEMNVPVRR